MNKWPIPWKQAGAAFAFFAFTLLPAMEGSSNKVYRDTGNVPTVCNGVTGPAIQMGMVFTDEECKTLNAERAMEAWMAVDKYVKVEIHLWEWVAYADLIYNIGEAQFRKSTLLRLLNAGEHRAACDQLPRWVYDNGVKLRGLVKRRALDWMICTGAINDEWTSPNHRKVRYD